MKKRLVLILLTLLAFVVFSQSQELELVDAYRMVDSDGYSFDYMLEEGPENESSKYIMRIFVKNNNEDAALCKYLSPEDMKGRIILVDDKYFWYLDRGMRSPIRISSRQMLFGQASAGDITRIIFSHFYEIEGREMESGSLRLDLKALPKKRAAYNTIKLYVNPESYKPYYALCYALSGQLLKKITYTSFGMYEGMEILTGMEISSLDGSDISRVTLMNFSLQKLDDLYFNKNLMSKIP